MAWEFRGPDPLYKQIATELRSRIERGVYQPGYAIPSNSALCEEFGVTHRTARMAVEILVEEGLLVGAVGRGMFVTDPDSRTPADQ
jgi:DNA-binding GntR family transcriptional regulator